MTRFYLDGQLYDAREGESVLDTLIRHGQQVNYSCKKGVCKTCLVQHLEGDINIGAQRGLTSGLKARHYICACQAVVSDELKLKSILPHDLFTPAVLEQKQYLNQSIVRIALKVEQGFIHQPGQYINLRRFDGVTRSYSLTNSPSDDLLELHVRRKYNGQFSDWLYHQANIGEKLLVQGPMGASSYDSQCQDNKLIVIAFGSGLGVAVSIVREALSHRHQGEIHLYVGGREMDDLYLHAELLQMMLEHRHFFYHACITGHHDVMPSGRRVMLGDPFNEAVKAHKFDRQQHLFLCGEPSLVNQSRKMAFLNGFPIERVHTLSFEYKDLRTRPRDL